MITLEAAFDMAADAETTGPEWSAAEKVLLAAGFCPHCAEDGERVKLGPVQPETADAYEHRICFTCASAYLTGQRPPPNEPDHGGTLGADGLIHSDADPGL